MTNHLNPHFVQETTFGMLFFSTAGKPLSGMEIRFKEITSRALVAATGTIAISDLGQ